MLTRDGKSDGTRKRAFWMVDFCDETINLGREDCISFENKTDTCTCVSSDHSGRGAW